jgi:glycogen operon protein
MIHFRAAHPVLRRSDFFRGENSSGYPELSFHGTRPWDLDEKQPFLCFGILYAEPRADYGTREDTFLYCAVNAFWEEKDFELPRLPDGFVWRELENTGRPGEAGGVLREGGLTLGPRSLALLTARRER